LSGVRVCLARNCLSGPGAQAWCHFGTRFQRPGFMQVGSRVLRVCGGGRGRAVRCQGISGPRLSVGMVRRRGATLAHASNGQVPCRWVLGFGVLGRHLPALVSGVVWTIAICRLGAQAWCHIGTQFQAQGYAYLHMHSGCYSKMTGNKCLFHLIRAAVFAY
jgi:hypothetical protein